MSFKLYKPVSRYQKKQGWGEYWRGETVEEHLRLTEYQTIVSTVRKFLPRGGGRILDAGCGLGRWLIYLRQLGFPVEGMDISTEAIEAIRKYDSSIPLVQGDVLKTPFANENFEAIISFGVIEHFETGPQEALNEAHRLLKEGGLLIVTVPYQNLIRRLIFNPVVWVARELLKLLGFSMSFLEYRFSKSEMVSFLEEAGFNVLLCQWDDFIYPKSMGLYADWRRIIGSKDRPWELNMFGKILQRFLGLFPMWWCCAGILVVAKKQDRMSQR